MRDWNKELNYKPYIGAAGPSQAQVASFLGALFIALVQEGLHQAKVEYDEDEDTAWVVLDGKRVTYDRWGFCNEDESGQCLDQVDLNAAVAYFMEKADA